MDDTDVATSNYTLEAGSTILTFKTNYLETLSVGEHIVTLYYTGDRSVETKLTVLEALSDETGKTEEGNDNSEDESIIEVSASDSQTDKNDQNRQTNSRAPITGDSNPSIWVMFIMLLISGSLCVALVKRYGQRK